MTNTTKEDTMVGKKKMPAAPQKCAVCYALSVWG
jgi:hypothetical protein